MITPRHLVTPACWHWEASDASSTTNKRVALGAGAHLQVLPSLLLPGLPLRASPALLPELPV